MGKMQDLFYLGCIVDMWEIGAIGYLGMIGALGGAERWMTGMSFPLNL